MLKRCEMCGCIMYDCTEFVVCECCLDDMREEDEDSGTGENF